MKLTRDTFFDTLFFFMVSLSLFPLFFCIANTQRVIPAIRVVTVRVKVITHQEQKQAAMKETPCQVTAARVVVVVVVVDLHSDKSDKINKNKNNE